MATSKKTTKSSKATKKSKKTKKAVPSHKEQLQSISEVAKEANKQRASNKGIVAIIAGILILAFVAAATLGERNQQFTDLTRYESDTYSVSYPEDWNFEEVDNSAEFFSATSPEDSAAGLTVLDTGKIPSYEQLEDSQRDELIELALESVRKDNESITSGFSTVVFSEIELANHPAADKSLRFELQGALDTGADGVLKGFMIITEAGDSYVISSGGNSEVYEVNQVVIDEMLASFRTIKPNSN